MAMNGLQKAGGCLTLLALPFIALAVMMFFDPPKGDTPLKALVPGLFFASVVLWPGLALWIVGGRSRREREFLDAVAQMVRSHDSFSVSELSRKIGRTELETEALIGRIAHRDPTIDLVFYRPRREYIHRQRLGGAHRIVDRCPHCGAPAQHQVVFPGDSVACTYCHGPLA